MTHWQQRTKRRIGWDGNLLRRKVDKAESLVIAGLVALLLVAAPLEGVFVGSRTRLHGTSSRASAAGIRPPPFCCRALATLRANKAKRVSPGSASAGPTATPGATTELWPLP